MGALLAISVNARADADERRRRKRFHIGRMLVLDDPPARIQLCRHRKIHNRGWQLPLHRAARSSRSVRVRHFPGAAR